MKSLRTCPLSTGVLSVFLWGCWHKVSVFWGQKSHNIRFRAQSTRRWHPHTLPLSPEGTRNSLWIPSVCRDNSSAEEQSSWWRWGSLASSGWRGALILSPYRGWGLGGENERLVSQELVVAPHSSASIKGCVIESVGVVRVRVFGGGRSAAVNLPVCIFSREMFPLKQ